MSAKKRCPHAKTEQVGPDRPYSHGVAVPPYTRENPAAHGCVEFPEECCSCGAQRKVLQNQRHLEYGPWGPDFAARHKREMEQANSEHERRISHYARVLKAYGMRVESVSLDRKTATVSVLGELCPFWVELIRAEAGEYDDGSLRVQLYRGLLAQVEAHLEMRDRGW